MPLQKPSGQTTTTIEGLGEMKGLKYSNGVRQFCGIPYASLSKRWTRSTLKTSWNESSHDGTKLGASAPNPKEYRGDIFLIPIEHGFEIPKEQELESLVMNLTLPPISASEAAACPVMVYIHGGSFLFGGANRPVYDCVNLVSHSFDIGSPVIAINFNYRVGIGGFLASQAIQDELAQNGFTGVGNFGLTDQQVALEWVQRYIAQLGGDRENVTLFGESAGSMSVDHQLHAADPAVFHRAILMSGLINTIPVWPLEHHERYYQALLMHLKIDKSAPDTLEKLRNLPDDVVADAATIVAGVIGTTGNPCDDGVFHAERPTYNASTAQPAQLKSLMVGDTYHEGVIFHGNIATDDYKSIRATMTESLGDAATTKILDLYQLHDKIPPPISHFIFEDMAGDALFKIPNYLNAHRSKLPETYGYHFDQRSTLDNIVKDTAYHGLDLLYVFMNMEEKMSKEQWALAKTMATAWITFAHGKDPWERFSVGNKWMVFGPQNEVQLKSEEEDEPVRHYGRMITIMDAGIYDKFVKAVDETGSKRSRLGQPPSSFPLPPGPPPPTS